MKVGSVMTKQQYFNRTVNKVLKGIGCILENLEITMMDHGTLERKHRDALGICWQMSNGEYRITIDEFFVDECYTYFVLDKVNSTWELEAKTLEYILCHEIAHIQEWRHGKKHTQLTKRLLSQVKQPKKYYEYLKKIA